MKCSRKGCISVWKMLGPHWNIQIFQITCMHQFELVVSCVFFRISVIKIHVFLCNHDYYNSDNLPDSIYVNANNNS